MDLLDSCSDELLFREGDGLGDGDVVADGGNSHWEDSRTRHAYFADAGVRFLDVGTSGGVSGARAGACFMVGGDREAFDLVAPVLVDLAIDEEGVLYVGPRAPATSRSSSITPSSSGWCSL